MVVKRAGRSGDLRIATRSKLCVLRSQGSKYLLRRYVVHVLCLEYHPQVLGFIEPPWIRAAGNASADV